MHCPRTVRGRTLRREGKGGTVDTPSDTTDEDRTTHNACVIAGAGPAGLVLGLLLARAGIEVTVLEKHADFLRDFRGDTVHPSTLDLLDDLGLFETFDALPQSHLQRVRLPGSDDEGATLADFSRLTVRHPYIAMVPQWDLLALLADAAAREPSFTLLTEHEVTGVVRDGDRVVGVDYSAPHGTGRILADLTVACDGRWSVVRRDVGLPATEAAVDFDAWWYRVPTDSRVGGSLLPRMRDGRVLIAIPREGYLQVARLGRKGDDAALRARGLEALRAETAALLPEVADDVSGIDSLDAVKHLDVRIDRLRRWYAGVCSASEMPRTPCRRWAGSASTWQSRTPSPQHVSSRRRSRTALHPWKSACLHGCSAGGLSRRCSPRACSVWSSDSSSCPDSTDGKSLCPGCSAAF